MASWGSYVFELCRINANQGLTAEIDWNYTSWSRRCRKILIGLVVRGAKTVVVRGKNRILTRNRKKPEMTVPISNSRSSGEKPNFDPKPQKTRNDSSYQFVLNISFCCVILQLDINKDVGGTETMTASIRLK